MTRFRGLEIDVVMLATADWDALVWTNKQHTARSLRDSGCKVLYVESMGLRRPTVSRRDFRRALVRLRRLVRSPQQVEEGIWRWSPPAVPLQRYKAIRVLNKALTVGLMRFWIARLGFDRPWLWTYNPLTMDLIDTRFAELVVYHCVDDISMQPLMPGALIRRSEVALVRQADFVFVTSRKLEERWSAVRPVTYHPNCVDFDHFNTAATSCPLPTTLSSPIVGFVGTIAAYKVDAEVLTEVAATHPEWALVLVGDQADNDPEIEQLLQIENVTHVSSQSYDALPSYMQQFDVGLIPARLNEYTEAMFPMKFFEYLAAGIPVVATKLPALKEFDNFCTLAEKDDFVRALERVVAADSSSERTRRLDVARNHTYARRTKRMLEEILISEDRDIDA